MAGYREITVGGGDGRVRRPAVKGRRPAPISGGGWKAVVMPLLAHGASRGLSLCRERPGAIFGAVVALGTAGFICVNALGYQQGRHPAPILPKVAARAPAKAIPAAPVAAENPASAEAPRDVQAEAAKPAPAPKPTPRDPIAELIRAEDTTASVNPKAKPAAPAKAEAAPAGDAAVLRAQRALAKLGYSKVKADGAMGPATKAAIEKFERDHKLPVTGEASGRTLRALESGAAKG
ncbi:peptidoglycan-binding domain-containing protein [Methylobacterium aerolatum]|uniref:Type IV secretory pathway VirB10-like protein n=1 Tax=Methylobacterium aerolatum TaxID=418708 RepID=A0ABU0HYS7_9HYPH|nr:peptidoglycan-binding domain-containing protein [Methylobacterium aerolatum]MDQ0447499.1 type IV secretory pathway VirB10-like protein [Methylobacterium aerolatum]GJD34600.1 hypothetical protein FMGBMHLM_1502 [Methylobacterium aerolatum]